MSDILTPNEFHRIRIRAALPATYEVSLSEVRALLRLIDALAEALMQDELAAKMRARVAAWLEEPNG